VHGFTATAEEMRPLGERLAARGFAVEGLLLPGHGSTLEAFARATFEDWYAAVMAGVERLRRQVPRVAVAGLSMGGLLALLAAARRPDLVDALVLYAPALELTANRQALLRLLTSVPGLPALLPFIAKRGGRGISDPALRAASPAYDRVPLTAIGQLLALKRLVRPLLPRIGQPVLALHGRGDQAVPLAVLDVLRAELGSRWIETEILERSWHVVTLDVEREHVAARTTTFLTQVEAATAGAAPAVVR
jgi:carboxylesterase